MRGVFYDYRRPLDAKVSGTSLFGWAAPREPCLGDVLLQFLHFRFRDRFVHDASPLAGQVQHHLALLLGQGRAFDSFRLNHLAVPSRAEHEVAHLEPKDSLKPG